MSEDSGLFRHKTDDTKSGLDLFVTEDKGLLARECLENSVGLTPPGFIENIKNIMIKRSSGEDGLTPLHFKFELHKRGLI